MRLTKVTRICTALMQIEINSRSISCQLPRVNRDLCETPTPNSKDPNHQLARPRYFFCAAGPISLLNAWYDTFSPAIADRAT
jgi:hypothetical protein